jgi:hypothetical protein
MKTLKKLKEENKIFGKYAFGNFSPYRISFNNKEELRKFLGSSFTSEIERAFEIARETGVISPKKQKELESLGFRLCFRGFNSQSGDVFVYQDEHERWYMSIGVANVNNAGRGYEIEL